MTQELLNGYITDDQILKHVDRYIIPSIFNRKGSNTTSGAVGALLLGDAAMRAVGGAALKK